MSLTKQQMEKIKNIPMDPLALANNIQLAYMVSFSNYSVSTDSVQCTPKDTYNSPLEVFNFVDFDQNTYQTLYSDTKKTYELKNSTAVKSIRNSFKQFFTRVSAMTYTTALKKDELLSLPSNKKLQFPTFQAEYKIDQMRGNSPVEWPRNLKQFHEQISKLPWNAFACQPELYFQDFFNLAFQSLNNFIKKLETAENKTSLIKDISLIIQIIIMISLKTTNQTYILIQLQALSKLQLDKIFKEIELHELMSRLQKICMEIFQKVPVNQEQQYHMPKKLWEKSSAFMIMKKIHFQRQNGLGYFTVANDGTYLYIYISSINGGMYKVGTGKNNSIAGKVYLQKQILLPVNTKPDQVSWVYLKGSLYLKSSARQPYLIQVINPNTFKSQSVIQLRCHSLYGHLSLVNLNRISVLMTDGQKLYILGKQLRITQSKYQKKQEQSKVIPQQQDTKANKKKKNKKNKGQQPAQQNQKQNPEQIQKVLQFVLCQFDTQAVQKEQQYDQKLAQQLFINFNNYFTIKQCRRALSLCENDLSQAAQWLVDQGEKQRTTKILYPSSKTIISQSQITSNFVEKNIKGSNEILTKQGSLLMVQNLQQYIWTMDEDQITCYTQQGLKIFSKSSADTHKINQISNLKTTHLKTVQGKCNKNPQYTISYDPYNRIFYTFVWPADGHYFPTAVLLGSDYKHFAQLSHQKKISLSQTDPRTFEQFPKWVLTKINMLDNTHCPQHGRVNNWLWYLAQKIVQINKQINSNNDNDKKKLTNKRAKYLTKMNKVNQHYRIYQKNKQEFQQKGKLVFEIKLIYPFGSDGSTENLYKIRNIYGKQIQPQQVYDFVFSLQGWLSNSPKIPNKKSQEILLSIRDQLIKIKPKLNSTSLRKLNNLFIENFFQFFLTDSERQSFITSLSNSQINVFIQKHHFSIYKQKKSIIYEIKNKQNILQKYESKNKFQQIFPTVSTVPLKQIYDNISIGNLLAPLKNNQNKKEKNILVKFLEKQIVNGQNGIKLFQYIFLEGFRSIVKQKKVQQYAKQLQQLFWKHLSLFYMQLGKQI